MRLAAHAIARHPVALVIAIAAVTVVTVSGLPKLELEATYRELFRSDDAVFARLEQLADDFGTGDGDCLVLFEAPDMLDRSALRVVRRAQFEVKQLDGVESVVSLHSVRRRQRIGRYFAPVFPGEGPEFSEERLERARARALAHPLIAGRLLSHDRRSSLMIVRLHTTRRSAEQTEAVLSRMREVLRMQTAGTDVTTGMTGLPVIRTDGLQILKRDHITLTVAGITLATLLAAVLLRRPGHVLIVVTPPLLGVAWTLGLMGLAGGRLGLLNSVLPALLLVIGVTDAVHIVFQYRRERAAGKPSKQSALRSVERVGGACFLTSLTTAVGFGSLVVCDEKVIRDLGLWAALGVSLTFLCVISLTPLLAMSPLGRVGSKSVPLSRTHTLFRRLAATLEARPSIWAACSLVVLIAASVAAAQLRADYSFVEHLPADSPARAVMQRCERQFGGAPLVQVLVGWSGGTDAKRGEIVGVLAQIHQAIDECSATSNPTSLLTLLESLPGKTDDLADRFDELPYVPKEAVLRCLLTDRRRALVSAAVPDAGASTLRRPLSALSRRLDGIAAQNPDFSVGLTGFQTLVTYRTSAMIAELVRSLMLASVVIFAVIAAAYRSLTFGLVSIVPNAFPLIATAALMVAVGKPLQYATVLAFAVCLGVAVDDTIHFLSRFRHERLAGADTAHAVRNTLDVMGPVLVTTTALMLTGIGAGIWAGLLTLRAFATFSCAALVLALIGDLVFLPALLLALARWGRTPEGGPNVTAQTSAGEMISCPEEVSDDLVAD
jgi:hypothetical protein